MHAIPASPGRSPRFPSCLVRRGSASLAVPGRALLVPGGMFPGCSHRVAAMTGHDDPDLMTGLHNQLGVLGVALAQWDGRDRTRGKAATPQSTPGRSVT